MQVACAVIAVGIGVFSQWNQISNAIDVGLVIKILLYPLAAVALVQLGKYFPTSARGQESIWKPKPDFDYRFLAPTLKIGSYFDLDQPFGIRRISAVSIQNDKSEPQDVPTVEIEVAGTALYFSGGSSVKKISDRRFRIPAYSRRLKDVDCSMYLFTYQKDYFSFAAISVDHINVPAQEATLAISLLEYRRG